MKNTLIKALMLFTTISLASCGPDTSNKGDTFTVTDFYKREVEIASNPTKFICAGSGSLRLYTYIADTAKLVGIERMELAEKDGGWGSSGRPYNLAIKNLTTLPIIGEGGPRASLNAELLLAAGADVIFLTTRMDVNEINDLQKKIATPIVTLSTSSNALFDESYYESMKLIGKITGNEERANAVVNYFETAKQDIKTRASKSTIHPTAYYGCRPYSGSHGIESTTNTYLGFDLLNVTNVAKDLGSVNATIDIEALLDLKPENIILDAHGFHKFKVQYEQKKSFFDSLDAFKNGNVYLQLPFNYYSTNIDIALANVYYLGTVLQPEQFKDIDAASKFDEITNFLLGISCYDSIANDYYGGYGKVNLNQK